MKTGRLAEMEKYIAQHDRVLLTTLCEHFGISMSTLRRDIQQLSDKGLIQKQYGSVCISKPVQQPAAGMLTYHDRSTINAEEKRIVSQIAASFVEEGDVIYIDSGSTTAFMVEYLSQLSHVTIVTNNLDVVIRARPYSNLEVYVLPGLFKRGNNSFSLLAESYIYDYYNIRKAFLACSGLSLTNGVSHMDLSERLIKRCTIDRTRACYLLVDHTKIGYTAPLYLCDISRFTAICTDVRPPQEYVDYCAQHNVGLYYAE